MDLRTEFSYLIEEGLRVNLIAYGHSEADGNEVYIVVDHVLSQDDKYGGSVCPVPNTSMHDFAMMFLTREYHRAKREPVLELRRTAHEIADGMHYDALEGK